MDLDNIERILCHKSTKAKIKGNTIITYNMLNDILEQLKKVHKLNEIQSIYDGMLKSNMEMADQIRDLKEQLRTATEQRAKSKIGILEAKNKSALKYLDKATWIDTKEKNDLINILGERYDWFDKFNVCNNRNYTFDTNNSIINYWDIKKKVEILSLIFDKILKMSRM